MKLLIKLTLASLSLFTIYPAIAADGMAPVSETPVPPTTAAGAPDASSPGSSDQIAKYLLHLGAGFGMDLKKNPKELTPPITIGQTLLNQPISTLKLLESYLITTFAGALPVNSLSPQILPKDAPGATLLNALANNTYKDPQKPYNNPSTDDVSVTKLLDQQTWQTDPVTQALLNILGTPDSTFCSYSGDKKLLDECPYLYPNKIMTNIVGSLPPATPIDGTFFSFKYNQNVLNQINTNSLLGPMIYSTDGSSANSTSSPTTPSQNTGLTAPTQAQQAANFIRYVSGTITPVQLPSFKDYSELQVIATASKDSPEKLKAQEVLNSYITDMRIYAARSSVSLSNLYYILQKRMGQKQGDGTISSQALSEFKMATRRITLDPDEKNPWIDQINTASAATVQKEIAILLAEMNYQLYLNRQLEERALMTASISVIQNLKNTLPRPTIKDDYKKK